MSTATKSHFSAKRAQKDTKSTNFAKMSLSAPQRHHLVEKRHFRSLCGIQKDLHSPVPNRGNSTIHSPPNARKLNNIKG